MTKEKTQTIEEKIINIQCNACVLNGNYCTSLKNSCELVNNNTNQIISIVRADERERIREGIEELKIRYITHYTPPLDKYEIIELRSIDDIRKLLSNKDVDTKEGE